MKVAVRYFRLQWFDSGGRVASLSEIPFVLEYDKCFNLCRIVDCFPHEVIFRWCIHKIIVGVGGYVLSFDSNEEGIRLK